MSRDTISNFGRNLSFSPREFLVPRNEAEVLEILNRYRGRKFRCIGRLHSWSEAASGDDVVLDLQHLNRVEIEVRDGEQWAVIGAGCQLKRVLSEMARLADCTLPTLGLITEQTIAGAASTGTHGSGKHSLSHYLDEVRVAVYDQVTGQPTVRVIQDGPELRAARCSLGCLGIILSVGIRCRPQYRIEEHFRNYADIQSVLAAEESYPLQQFYFVPWRWDFFAQHRREATNGRSRLAALYRLYFFLVFDLTFHLILLPLVNIIRSRKLIQFFYKHILPWTVIRGWKVVDQSQAMLVMEHELFRHVEIELFVKRADLPAVLADVREFMGYAGGDSSELSAATLDRLRVHRLEKSLEGCRGCYTHHYPICVRRVLADDTMLSATADFNEPGYAVSLITYARPAAGQGFRQFANFLAHSFIAMGAAMKTSPHSIRRSDRSPNMSMRTPTLPSMWDRFCLAKQPA